VSNFALTSAEPQKGERRESDYYPTPIALAERIVATVENVPHSILEPSAGSGSFVRACQARFPNASILAVEPSSQHWDSLIDLGATVGESTLEQHVHSYGDERFDLIIGNPPFSLALEHIELCLDLLAPGGRLVFLLRLAFLESKGRIPFWKQHTPRRVIVIPERPSFTGGATDKTAYAAFEWGDATATRTDLEWLW
jgi:type I restriction-modification system DNA methylase subunit